MYAFAIWDDFEKKLFLARDRLGIKPVYYSNAGGTFVFASELKALESSGLISFYINPAALCLIFCWVLFLVIWGLSRCLCP